MTNKKHRVFTKTEMKILVFNKMKQKGLDYVHACKELSEEIEAVRENHNNIVKEKPTFREEFKKLTGKRT